MNYQKIYDKIIDNARKSNRIKNQEIFYEDHHILPKCLGGNNNKINRVLLTPKEHFICHKLLTFIFTNNRKIICAFHRMSTSKKYHISSRDYDYAKNIFSRSMMGDLNPSKNKCVVEKIRIGNIGKKRSLESKINYSNSKKGHVVSEETIRKIKVTKQDIKLSDQHKINISVGLKMAYENNKIVKDHRGNKNPMFGKKRKLNNKTCIFCNKIVDAQNYAKYHGENCKFKIIAA
jgi:hypothetical protein